MKRIKDEKLQVYYNSACPVCKTGIDLQKSRTTNCDVSWKDIHRNNVYIAEVDSEINFVRKYLHLIDSRGQKHIGIDAFIQLWKYSPNEQWKARLFSTPFLKHMAKIVYFVFANILFAWNRMMKHGNDSGLEGKDG